MIDFSVIDVEDLLSRLDLGNARLTSSGREVNFSCFGAEHSHGDESPSAYINTETTAWFCHGCKRRGNAVGLVMEIHQVERSTAERTLREWYGIEFNEPIGGSMVAETEARFREKEPAPQPVPPSPSWLIGARVEWDEEAERASEPWASYIFGRGFSAETLMSWDVGYDYLSDRITIPVFDVDGTLIGVKGRAWREGHDPKYIVLGDREHQRHGFHPYVASEVVFGLHRNRHCRTVVIFEGELNAMASSQVGVERPVAIGMSYFSSRHAQLVLREAEEAVVFLDYGEAGEIGTWGRTDDKGVFHPGVVHQLQDHMRVRIVEPLPEDPAKLVEDGQGDVVLELIERAKSSLTISTTFR